MADYIGGPVARRKKGVTKYLVMWTRELSANSSLGEPRLKFAGGTEHTAEHGDLDETYRRELEEETGLRLKPGAEITLLKTLCDKCHHKNFVRVWRRDCEGSLRREPIWDGETWLSPPFFADKKFLIDNLYGDHRIVLDELI